jgi:hypothetical protein
MASIIGSSQGYDYAIGLVHSVCCLAGVPSYVDDLRAQLRHGGVLEAVRERDTPRGAPQNRWRRGRDQGALKRTTRRRGFPKRRSRSVRKAGSGGGI